MLKGSWHDGQHRREGRAAEAGAGATAAASGSATGEESTVSFGGKRALALLTIDPGLDAGSDDTSGVPIAPSTLALNSLNGDTLPPPGGWVDGDEVDTAMLAPMPTDWFVDG